MATKLRVILRKLDTTPSRIGFSCWRWHYPCYYVPQRATQFKAGETVRVSNQVKPEVIVGPGIGRVFFGVRVYDPGTGRSEIWMNGEVRRENSAPRPVSIR